jgi:recombination protein RecA
MYGNPEVTTGGRALKFYASVRIDVRKVDTLKNGSDIYGSRTRCKVVKNKVAPPFKTAEFDILYGSGISKSTEVIDLAIQLEVVEKSGAWFYFEGQRLGQGKENVRKLIETDKELLDKLESLVREKMQNNEIDPDAAAEDADEFDIKDFDEGDDL